MSWFLPVDLWMEIRLEPALSPSNAPAARHLSLLK
jgi:hypothetical protein